MAELLDALKNPQVQVVLAGIVAWALQRWATWIPGNDGSAVWAKKTAAAVLAVVVAVLVSWGSGDWSSLWSSVLLALAASQTTFALMSKGSVPNDTEHA
jgi:hypothetical protein